MVNNLTTDNRILNSNSIAVFVNDTSQGFSTSNLDCKLYMTVQDFNYSIQLPRQNLKQVGSQNLSFKGFNFQPDVELSFKYIPEVLGQNETNGHFVKRLGSASDGGFLNFFSETLERNSNFYIMIDREGGAKGHDIFDKMSFDEETMNLSGLECIAFGNCFPTAYGLNYSVGSMPVVSTNYICSNVVTERITGTFMDLPSINLENGNNNNVGKCLFEIGKDTVASPTDPLIVNPVGSDTSVILENLEVGGQNLSGVHYIQSLDMSVDLPRASLYGLGNDFSYSRKAQLPANGRFSVSSLVSGLDSGVMTGVLTNDNDYNFEIKFQALNQDKNLTYKVEDAKLDSYNYGIAVNNFMTFNAEFSFEVTEDNGLKFRGTTY